MEITYYGYPKCSTCRNAKKWLEAKEFNFKEVNIAETPPTESELREIIATSGLEIKKFFNTSGKVYRELKLKDKLPTMTEAEKISLLSSDGMLIKRPIVHGNGKTTVGFKEEDFEKVWK
ncbi:arsenate reductase family protein [Sporosarcina sp. G11-34]|uniref:arsenate reductase family protein n=1 Tax=Sporosarcina sp. G11-34 TaxID=2849605 RepID=UPI0022A9AE66|nr:arsenate reductase family protein [Sporosarcina sp. G11-34]MCZ2260482.1 arsenate reductase family protein [Sporosarcina sp. G11-34]